MTSRSRLSVLFCTLTAIVHGISATQLDKELCSISGDKLDRLSSHNDEIIPSYAIPPIKADPTAGVFKVIGGKSLSRPCCVSWGKGRIDCFIHSETSSVHHWWKEKDETHEWEDLGGAIIGGIECVSRNLGLLDLMTVGTMSDLWVKRYDGRWYQWMSIGGQLMEEPSCAVRTSTSIACMVRGSNNRAYYVSSIGRKWSRFTSRGGKQRFPIGASSRMPTSLNFFACGMNGHLYHIYWQGEWGSWKDLGGFVQGRPEIVTLNKNRIDVFVLGMTNQLMHLTWNGEWQPWEDLGGILQDVPSCVGWDTNIHCFGLGPKSYLYRNSYDGEKWTGWISSYGAFLDSPSCVESNENEVSCYMRGFKREIIEMVFKF